MVHVHCYPFKMFVKFVSIGFILLTYKLRNNYVIMIFVIFNVIFLHHFKIINSYNNNNNSISSFPLSTGGGIHSHCNNTDHCIFLGFLGGYSDLKYVLGAIKLAIDDVNKDEHLLPGKLLVLRAEDIGSSKNVHGVERYRSSSASLAVRKMTEMKDKGVTAFIGPDGSCTCEALVATAWNMPMISYDCSDNKVSNKEVYQTFARTLPPFSKVSKSVVSLLQQFEWNMFVIIVEKYPTWCITVATAIKDLAELNMLNVTDYYQFSNHLPKNDEEISRIVKDSYDRTRVYVFVGEHIALISFLRCMQDRRLMESGNYVVLSVDDEVYDPIVVDKSSVKLLLNDSVEPEWYRNLFQSVLKVTSSQPRNPKYWEVCDKMKQYSKESPFFVPSPPTILNSPPLSITAAFLYDAVKIYAKAVTLVIKDNGNISDGSAIIRKILNHTYQSIRGYDVYIDENGDAEGNYSVVSLSSSDKNDRQMVSVGHFVYPINNSRALPKFEFQEGRSFYWVTGSPPKAEPVCGFDNRHCFYHARYIMMYGFGGMAVLLLVAVISHKYSEYKRKKYTSEWWKIDLKDVETIHKGSTCYVKSNDAANIPRDCKLHLGNYKGNLVVLKPVYKKSIVVTQALSDELVQVRALRHENIAHFIGACVEPGNLYILIEYCTRGSLENVLKNYDIKLDNMFIASLVADIIKGMMYVHQGPIVKHGNLRSSNCLIDSRWVIRISDFGLHEFKANEEDPNKMDKNMKRNLYRAPEMIDCEPSKGTQKGDVYSFGILLYEIVGRNGPWGPINMTDQEIISRVKETPDFRPITTMLKTDKFIINCMERCWISNHEERPDFVTIREMLKDLHKGLKSNIFDNMLSIMEKYAYNLEELVRERTDELSREKKRTEQLLYEMLPKSVAETLKQGLRVVAESYESVTVYFSDIVDFTSLASTCTPLQVVDFLNDLYTTCDLIVSSFDAYKVETIGDAYMVVSGLPIRNGNKHAAEIASMALTLLQAVGLFHSRHLNEPLKLRIGIHTGRCVAGVIGCRMPRYCLFGDTVNTASRMESSGQPLKIHISDATYRLLQDIGGYVCAPRGKICVKGKGEMTTYWLLGRDASVVDGKFVDTCCVDVQEENTFQTIHSSLQRLRRHADTMVRPLVDAVAWNSMKERKGRLYATIR